MMFLKKPGLLHMNEDYLRKLAKTNPEALIKLGLQLVDDLKGILEREEQSFSNSTRPPGSDATWEKLEDAIEDDELDAILRGKPLPSRTSHQGR